MRAARVLVVSLFFLVGCGECLKATPPDRVPVKDPGSAAVPPADPLPAPPPPPSQIPKDPGERLVQQNVELQRLSQELQTMRQEIRALRD